MAVLTEDGQRKDNTRKITPKHVAHACIRLIAVFLAIHAALVRLMGSGFLKILWCWSFPPSVALFICARFKQGPTLRIINAAGALCLFSSGLFAVLSQRSRLHSPYSIYKTSPPMENADKPIDVFMFATKNLNYARPVASMWNSFCAKGKNCVFSLETRQVDVAVSGLEHPNWNKLWRLRERMQMRGAPDRIMLVDADVILADVSVPLEEMFEAYLPKDGLKSIAMAEDRSLSRSFWGCLSTVGDIFHFRGRCGPNAGIILIRNNDASKAFLTSWLSSALKCLSLANSRTAPPNQRVLYTCGALDEHWKHIAIVGNVHFGSSDSLFLQHRFDIPRKNRTEAVFTELVEGAGFQM